MWPTHLGFDRYYGFLNGETNQWTPNLVRDQTHVEPPATPEAGYHLDADLADEAIAQLRDLRLHQPDRPFLLWYATGSPHAPHQAPPEWIDRYRGRFDDGWDVWRERTLARQIELGILPAGTELSPRPPWVEAWDDIDADRRRLYARMMEVFAGVLSHLDHHVGRVLDELQRDDDTVVVLVSDNGTSAEGGPNGTWNQLRHYLNDEADDLAAELAHLDDLGGFRSSGHYPWGWALAGNTPFPRWKRYTFEGGVRDPLIVSWPGHLPDEGGLRHQYVHAVDVLPTVLDLVGVEAPAVLRGVEQMTHDGVSIRAAIDDPAAPDPRTEQHYECWGSRAMYADGWKVVTNHVNQLTAAERDAIDGSADFATDRWLLYDTRTDPTECHDVADEHPDVVADLVARWDAAAERNHVLPLDDSRDNRVAQLHLPWITFRSTYDLVPGDKVHESNGPLLFGGFRMVARFAAPGLTAFDTGVLCEQGDWIAGWAWFLGGGATTWCLTWNGVEHRITAPIEPGAELVAIDATPRSAGGFDLVLRVGETAVRGELPIAFPQSIAPDGAFLTVGYGRPFPISDDYDPPAPAPATLESVRITTGAPPPFDLDAELAHAMRHQ